MALSPAVLSSLVNELIFRAVGHALNRQDVPIASPDVPAATDKTAIAVIDAIEAHPGVAVVPVQSPFTSKINWTAVLSLTIVVATIFGIPVTPEQKADIIAGASALSSVLIIVFKTFFTKSISAGSK